MTGQGGNERSASFLATIRRPFEKYFEKVVAVAEGQLPYPLCDFWRYAKSLLAHPNHPPTLRLGAHPLVAATERLVAATAPLFVSIGDVDEVPLFGATGGGGCKCYFGRVGGGS